MRSASKLIDIIFYGTRNPVDPDQKYCRSLITRPDWLDSANNPFYATGPLSKDEIDMWASMMFSEVYASSLLSPCEIFIWHVRIEVFVLIGKCTHF